MRPAAGAADKAEEELRRTLLESDNSALIAQREYFPEHYETVVRLLARMRGGTRALMDADRDRYHGPVGAYISTFIETAARAGPEPELPDEEIDAGMADLNELYRIAQECSSDPYLHAALRPGPLLHSRYCAAAVQVLTTALETEAPLGPRLWRYLVTQPAGR